MSAVAELRARRRAHKSKSKPSPLWTAGLRRKVDAAARKRDRMAELIADGATITEAGAAVGVGQAQAFKLWRQVKDALGWQAFA